MPTFELGDYKIFDCVIGAGGQGNVFTGEHIPSNDDVAVKCISLTRDSAKLGYKNEVAALTRLYTSKYCIKMIDSFVYENTGILVLEQGTCDVLEYYLTKAPTQDKIKNILLSMAKGVQELHSNGIAHMDLKPDNCLLFDDDNTVKLCDFGNSLFFKPNVKYLGKRGSPGYVCPEMMTGKAFDPKAADIWALGICFHVLLTGYFPYEETDRESFSIKNFNLNHLENDSLAKKLVSRMLSYDQDHRLTIDEVLAHPYFQPVIPKVRLPNSRLARIKYQARRLLQSI